MEQRQHLYRQVLVADINMEFYQRKKGILKTNFMLFHWVAIVWGLISCVKL